jgi:hypothetical protein
MADYRTFRARIFPIPPKATRRLTLRYDATLPLDGKTVTFQYPLQGSLSYRGAGVPIRPPMPIPSQREEQSHSFATEHDSHSDQYHHRGEKYLFAFTSY